MWKITPVLLILLSVLASAQTVTVTLVDVLLYEYPGVEWTLEEPGFPEDPEITLWTNTTDPQPTIDALETLRDNPSAALLEAVRTGVFPEPPG